MYRNWVFQCVFENQGYVSELGLRSFENHGYYQNWVFDFFENHGYISELGLWFFLRTMVMNSWARGGGTTLNPKIKTHREPIFEVKIEANKLG